MKRLYTVLPVFLVGMVLGVSLSASAAAQPVHAALGSDIVCLVFTDLDHVGTPIPFLSTGNCPSGSSTSTMPTLTVTKIVSGGSKVVSDFPLLLNGLPITSGVSTTTLPGTYTVTEINTDTHYSGTFSGDCDSSGSITLLANTNNTCTLTNTYTASGGGGGSGPHATSTDLSLTKTVSTSTPIEGQTVTYTLTVHNAGPDAADHVSVTDILPSGLTYVSDTGAGSYAASTGVWTVGSVATTSDVSLSIVATVGSTTSTIINTASVVGTNSTDPNSANNTSSASITPTAPSTSGGNNGGSGGNSGGSDTGSSTGGGTGGSSSTVTPNITSGGGGGVVSGPLSYGYGNGGAVLGTSTEATSPASCGLYLTSYLRMGNKNNSGQVTKLQTFLNTYSGAKLPVTGFFGSLTDAAVRKFQAQYAADVLKPWAPYGLAANATTGYVYKTTLRKINLIMCSQLNLPMPLLP